MAEATFITFVPTGKVQSFAEHLKPRTQVHCVGPNWKLFLGVSFLFLDPSSLRKGRTNTWSSGYLVNEFVKTLANRNCSRDWLFERLWDGESSIDER